MSDEASEQAASVRPLLRVVRGDPTAEEVAALVAVLASRGGNEPAPEPPRSPWGRADSVIRSPLSTRLGAWRESGFAPGLRTRADW